MDGTFLCLMKTIYFLFLLKWSVFAFSEFETTSSPSEITSSPSGCDLNCSLSSMMGEPDLICHNVTSLGDIARCAPITTKFITVSSSNFTYLPGEIFHTFKDLWSLDLASNAIKHLPAGVFSPLSLLLYLDLSSNAITSLPDGVFSNQRWLSRIDLSSNALTSLPHSVFANQGNLNQLYLSSNAIASLPDRMFSAALPPILDLSSNAIKSVPVGVFTDAKNLITLVSLNLSSNAITSLPAGVFDNLTSLHELDLSFNKIQYLPKCVFCSTPSLRFVMLQRNMIKFITNETFAKTTDINFLSIGGNQLENIPQGAFYKLNVPQSSSSRFSQGFKKSSLVLMFSDNPLKIIEPKAFRWVNIQLGMHIFLLRTKLKTFSLDSFIGQNVQDSRIMIKDRTITKVIYLSTRSTEVTLHLNPDDTQTEAVHIPRPYTDSGRLQTSAFLASGFRLLGINYTVARVLPCPLGTFSNPFTQGTGRCTNCPPGGFYSDDVGYVGESCKKCPNGSFVRFDKAPGTSKQDCKSCPQGTETDFFAGFRACKCLEGFYRTQMFEKCHKCVGGLTCRDDYASLKSGYWWEWRNKTRKDRYRRFIANLLAVSPALDVSSVQYPFPIPVSYRCPREESCQGGLDSVCETGYQGPLCQVCSSGYYKQLQACTRCPSKTWIVGQLSIIVAIAIMITAVSLWTSKRKKKKGEKYPFIDMFFSKLKIVIGFYQVTHGLLQAFSYIKWPGSLQVIAKYSEILQMDVLQIAPMGCLINGFQVNAFGSLLAIMVINAAAISISVAVYAVRKAIIVWNPNPQNDEKSRSRKISETKELVFRNLFFFLYVTYLSTCAQTASVLPIACQKLCRDDKEEFCLKYMKADYSIKCQGKYYNHWLIVAYISTAYIVTLPVFSFTVLWKKRRAMVAANELHGPDTGMELISGLRFLFENYEHRAWYWELVETSRKVILTSGLILVGEESRSYIGLAWVIAGMYGIVFSWMKPIRDATENRLMATSLAVTVFNLGVGAVSRIPAENISVSVDKDMDGVLFKILVLGANTLVIGLLVVQYLVFLYGYIKEWRKNPHWSFSCCLALLVPLNELQGELRGLAEANDLKTQVEMEQIEKPSIVSAMQDSGAIDGTLEEDDDDNMKIQEEYKQDGAYRHTSRHQGTQTEIRSVPITDVLLHGPLTVSNGEWKCQESIQPNRNHSIDKEEVNNSKDEAGKEATNNTNLK